MSYPITFGKYQLLERINVGGMAEVFKAKAFGIEGFERILAIKRILPTMAEDDEFIKMFTDEARIAVQLTHPNIVPIYELGKFENQYYMAMEYVAGKDLRQVLDRFRKANALLPIPAAAYLVARICEGLDYAHRKADASGRPLNVIHRDVSPQNILLSYEGAVKITDFGIVKAESRESKTQAGVLKGKFGYMSPEQVRGLPIDHRSDIFAVGILLYEALTGKRLFIGESDFSTLERVRNAEVEPASTHNPLISEALDRVVLKALARERDERYGWAMELHDDLQQFVLDDGGVFNGTKLSALLKEEYQEEIAAEKSKIEAFMRMPPPTSHEALEAAAQMRAAPTGDWNDARGEKTMIFESGFGGLADANTQIGSLESVGALPPATLPPTQQAEVVLPRRPRAGVTLLGVALLALAGLGAFLYFERSKSNVGTLIVTSSPTDLVEVSLDGNVIGGHTPIIDSSVPLGEHELVARSPGYADKVYRFDLVANDAPANINIELERTGLVAERGEATIEVTSEPPLAAVRLGGVPQGTTPYTMTVRDTSHPVVLEVVRTGYISQTVTVSFAPGEKKKAVHVAMAAGAGGVRLPPGVTPAKLVVKSNPDGATVYLSGVEMGQTPREIGDLDPRQVYTLELTKEGFRPVEDTVRFANETVVSRQYDLSRDRRGGTHVLPRVGLPPAGEPRAGSAPVRPPRSDRCGGTGGRLSVMPVGMADCTVTVGPQALGMAPIVNHAAPVGRCTIDVKCPGNKHYQTIRQLRPGVVEKVIIKGDDWQAQP